MDYIGSDSIASDSKASDSIANDSIAPTFPERRLQVLCFLAKEGATNAYQIAIGTGIRYPVVHEAVKDLSLCGFIKLEGEGQGKKGVTTQIYGLTLKGLTVAIKLGHVEADMDKITERWKRLLPLVLGKWPYFKQMGLEGEVLTFLRKEAEAWSQVMAITGEGGSTWLDDMAERFSMARFRNFMFSLRSWESRLKWYKAVRGDKELKEWAARALKGEIARAEAWAGIMKETLTLVLARQEPDWDEVKRKQATWPAALLAP